MPVTEVIQGPGQWSVTLSENTPRDLLDKIQAAYFGHIAISAGWNDPRVAGDSLLTSARYVGPMTGVSLVDGTGFQLSGSGMWTWLTGPNGVGSTAYETALNITSKNFSQAISAALAPVSSVRVGNLTNPSSGLLTQSYQFTDPATVLTSIGSLMGGLIRVNGNGTVDAGPPSAIFNTIPTALIVANDSGGDMGLTAIQGFNSLNEDVTDWTSRVVLLGDNNGTTVSSGTANLADIGSSNPYKDLFGNPVARVRTASDSSTDSTNVTAQAQALLQQYDTPVDQILLNSMEYDIRGTFAVGDYIFVYDPEADLVDLTNEITFHGQRINPLKIQSTEVDWPITPGMGVAFRDGAGVWYDLTPYVIFEDDTTNIVVGGLNRPLVSGGESVTLRTSTGTVTPSVPGVPVFGAFTTAAYQSASDGSTKAQIQATWSTPLNVDGSTITDGDHYEIQYRPDFGVFTTNPSHNQLNSAGYTHAQLAALGGTLNQLIPLPITQWKVTYVAWGINTLLIQELTPGVNYDFQIRAVNSALPPVPGAWSATTTVQAQTDIIAPQTPDAPTVAANMASVQVTWDCGSASGGSFNQAVDLNHIEVHGSYEPLFTPTNDTKLGNVGATIANIAGQIPVVASFTIPPGQPPAQQMYIKIVAVDTSGNKSSPSAAAGATAQLWSDAYITDLNVSKITAGTLTASVIMGGTIATALSGVRAGMDSSGFWAYDADGDQTFFVNAATGQVTLSSSGQGQRISLKTGVDLTPYAGPGSADALEFWPDSSVTNPPLIAGYDLHAGGSAITAFSGIVPDTVFGVSSNYVWAMSLQGSTAGNGNALISYLDTATNAFNGGAVQVASSFAFVGVANEGGIAGGFLSALSPPSSSTDIKLEQVGYYGDNGQVGPNLSDAVIHGNITPISSSLTTQPWSYGPTMLSTPMVLCNASCGTSGAPAVGGVNTSLSTTGFIYKISAAMPSNWSLFFFGVRTRA